MAIPQDWMPPGMPDEQKDEIAAKHPDDPAAAAAEAWAVWAMEMPVDEQGVTKVQTGAQSVTYDKSPYESAMERARWYMTRSKSATSLDVGGEYKYGWNRHHRWTNTSEAGEGDPALPNGEPWGSITITSADVVLTNGTGPLNRSNFQTQEDANTELVQQIALKADQDHVHADDGSAVDLTDYETKADAAAAHNTLEQEINTGLAGKSDTGHVHDTDLSGYVTKDEADAAHQELDQKIDDAAAGDHSHADYETKVDSKAGDEALSRRITQVSTDKADTGHGHIDYETKLQAQESHQDLQDQIDDRALVSHAHPDATPDLSDYETKVASETRDAGLENQIKQKADVTHTHPEVQPPDLTNYVTKPDLAADQARQDQALTEGLAEKSETSHVHDGSDGGAQYELEADAVQRYERTALELSTKADKDHDHGATDHDHDDLASLVELQTETALRKQGDDDLQAQINGAVAGGHDHDNDYASKSHGHGNYADSNHAHPEYENQGGSGDVTKAYVDAQDATEKQAREAGDTALQAQIDSIQHTPPYDDTQITADLAQEVADREDGDKAISDDLKQEISDREDADTEIKEAALTGILAVDYDMRYQDSQYQIRLDYRLFGEPTLGGKETEFHDGDSWPIVVDDDLLHFESLAPSDRPQLMFKGEKLPANTKYAFLHFRSERQEWKVSKVEYANGVNRVYGYAVTGNLIVSETAKVDAWFLTEAEALSAPDVTGDLLDLTGETTGFTGVENFQSKGGLQYKNASFTLGMDVVVKVAQFNANPTSVGLNHDIVPSGRVMWVDQFPVGSTMIIQGAAATLALEVTASRKSGSNNRAHGFDVNVLFESGAFVDGELLQIGSGDLVGGRRLLLDDVVVGDSGWEDRIATLESDVDGLGDDHATSLDLLQTQVQLEAVAPTVESGDWTIVYNQPTVGPGEVQVDTFSGTSPNSIYINETDLAGNSHGFADVKVGDFVETVINAERWTVHKVFNIRSGDPGVRIYDIMPHANEGNLQNGNKAFVRFFQVNSGSEDLEALEERVAYLETALQSFLPFSLGVYPTKMDSYEPTGSSQEDGTAVTWWIDAVNNTTPENHARIGMVDKDLSIKVANMPVPFELDLIQGDLKQTWVILSAYERGSGVLHLVSNGGWGDRLTHSVGTAVDTDYVVRKI